MAGARYTAFGTKRRDTETKPVPCSSLSNRDSEDDVRSIINWAFACISACISCLTWTQGARAVEYNYLTTEKPTVLLSINDGEVPSLLAAYNPDIGSLEERVVVPAGGMVRVALELGAQE